MLYTNIYSYPGNPSIDKELFFVKIGIKIFFFIHFLFSTHKPLQNTRSLAFLEGCIQIANHNKNICLDTSKSYPGNPL